MELNVHPCQFHLCSEGHQMWQLEPTLPFIKGASKAMVNAEHQGFIFDNISFGQLSHLLVPNTVKGFNRPT